MEKLTEINTFSTISFTFSPDKGFNGAFLNLAFNHCMEGHMKLFQVKSGVPKLPGCYNSLYSHHFLVSTGVPDLDQLIGK